MKSQAERIKEIGLSKWLDEPMDLTEFYGEPMKEVDIGNWWVLLGAVLCAASAAHDDFRGC